jgi:hypothetical protein
MSNKTDDIGLLMKPIDPRNTISAILKHDKKITSYKIALLRSINDVALSFPNLRDFNKDIAVPLRMLAEFWVAYFWPFSNPNEPIWQGPRSNRNGQLTNDMAFRKELQQFRKKLQNNTNSFSQPSDGFFITNEMRIPRRRDTYQGMFKQYEAVLRKIGITIGNMPVRYAGPGEYTIFDEPALFSQIRMHTIPLPSTQDNDLCIVIKSDLWKTFQEMSLYIEALCIHEWCLFTERVDQGDGVSISRGEIYQILTTRPDNRRPLDWERNRVDLLLMEGEVFTCPWTEKQITQPTDYDLDHLLPISIYPINEMWNLVPSDPYFNEHIKRNRIPAPDRLLKAKPHLEKTYTNYTKLHELANALYEDADSRFPGLSIENAEYPASVASSVVVFIDKVGSYRNLARF